jgi:hypothetical protein
VLPRPRGASASRINRAQQNPSTTPAKKIVLDFFFFFADDRSMGLLTDFLKLNEQLCISDEKTFLSEYEAADYDVSGFRSATAEQLVGRVTTIYVTPAGERWLLEFKKHQAARVLLEKRGLDLDREIKLWAGWDSKQAQTAEDLGPARSHKAKGVDSTPKRGTPRGKAREFSWKLR